MLLLHHMDDQSYERSTIINYCSDNYKQYDARVLQLSAYVPIRLDANSTVNTMMILLQAIVSSCFYNLTLQPQYLLLAHHCSGILVLVNTSRMVIHNKVIRCWQQINQILVRCFKGALFTEAFSLKLLLSLYKLMLLKSIGQSVLHQTQNRKIASIPRYEISDAKQQT